MFESSEIDNRVKGNITLSLQQQQILQLRVVLSGMECSQYVQLEKRIYTHIPVRSPLEI